MCRWKTGQIIVLDMDSWGEYYYILVILVIDMLQNPGMEKKMFLDSQYIFYKGLPTFLSQCYIY